MGGNLKGKLGGDFSWGRANAEDKNKNNLLRECCDSDGYGSSITNGRNASKLG